MFYGLKYSQSSQNQVVCYRLSQNFTGKGLAHPLILLRTSKLSNCLTDHEGNSGIMKTQNNYIAKMETKYWLCPMA